MENFLNYARHVNLDDFRINWVKNVIGAKIKKTELSIEEVEHIIDFLASSAAPKRIDKMSYEQAKTSAEKWLKAQIKKGSAIEEKPEDTQTVLDFGDGFRVAKLVGENAYKREGFLMSHCVGGYYGRNVEVYSLRDNKNMPHATMEKNQQIKGKGNGDIHPKYVGYIVKFLEHVGMTVGDAEMAHIGYMNVEEFKSELSSELFNQKYYPRNKKLLAKDGQEFCDFGLWDKVPLVEFDSNVSFKINFDLISFLSRAVSKIFDFLQGLKAKTEKILSDNSKNYAKIGSSGDSAQIGSSGDSAQIGSSGNYAQIGSSGDSAQIGSSGDSAQIGSSGDSAQIGSSGDSAQIGSSGNYAKIGSSGDSAQIGSSGDSAQIGSSGDSAQIGSSGNYAQIELNGEDGVGVSAGINCVIKGKIGNWITLSEWKEDSKKNRFVPVSVKSAKIDGKILKEDVFYKLVDGKFVEQKMENKT